MTRKGPGTIVRQRRAGKWWQRRPLRPKVGRVRLNNFMNVPLSIGMITRTLVGAVAVRRRRLMGWFAVTMAISGSLQGQTVFCVENNGKLEVVQRASHSEAFVQENGTWVGYPNGPFLVKPAPEYLPALVTIHNRHFGKGRRAISDSGPSSARLVHAGRFVYTADLETTTPLTHVVLVLELGGEKEQDTMFWAHEVRDMLPNRLERVSVDVMTNLKLRGIHLKRTYLYSNGLEVFTSELPQMLREVALNKIVAKRMAGQTGAVDVVARPLFAPEAQFPEKLSTSAKGDATVVFRVDAKGFVLEPAVTSSSLPELSAPALAAIQQWRFVPAMKSGIPVESRGSYTFHFEVPSSW